MKRLCVVLKAAHVSPKSWCILQHVGITDRLVTDHWPYPTLRQTLTPGNSLDGSAAPVFISSWNGLQYSLITPDYGFVLRKVRPKMPPRPSHLLDTIQASFGTVKILLSFLDGTHCRAYERFAKVIPSSFFMFVSELEAVEPSEISWAGFFQLVLLHTLKFLLTSPELPRPNFSGTSKKASERQLVRQTIDLKWTTSQNKCSNHCILFYFHSAYCKDVAYDIYRNLTVFTEVSSLTLTLT